MLGASHWQEAHSGLVLTAGSTTTRTSIGYYYEDFLAVVEMLIQHRRLPDTLILSIRDMNLRALWTCAPILSG